MTYEIKNLTELENSVSDLSAVNEKIKSQADSLENLINKIKTNWTNDSGEDILSILTNLSECVKKLEGAITPTINKYVETMNTLVENSRITQSNTI